MDTREKTNRTRQENKTRTIILKHFPHTIDRLQEAHWFLHQIVMWYHKADPFRYSLNSFIRSLREVDHMLRAELKPFSEHALWYKKRIKELVNEEPLIEKLVRTRDLIVHQHMLAPSSKATVGVCDLRGIRSGFLFDVSPFMDSNRIASNARKAGRGSGLFLPDEDQAFGIERRWGIKEWDDEEIVVVCAKIWLKVATLFDEILGRFGGKPVRVGLDCLHGHGSYRLEIIEFGDDPKVRRRKQRYLKGKMDEMAKAKQESVGNTERSK